ncbi:MFS transporter [Bradyrhizobium sp. BR 10289]|nr:MFS transporter [Bradyrhizobium sp. BR 10289]
MIQHVTLQVANSGPRLDRLPLGPWHYRLLALITAGLFVDTFELYSAGAVLAALVQSGWSTMSLNATFLTATFVGLTAGAWGAGIVGDRYGRRFCYQLNLLVFGLASVAAAFAPNMTILIVLRFVMGLGLGAEIVVGYATMAEFIPAKYRGRIIASMVLMANASSIVALLTASWVVPSLGWRWMFLLPGAAALLIWFFRRSLPESPRWLEAVGRTSEANALLDGIELASNIVTANPGSASAGRATVQSRAVTPLSVLFERQTVLRTIVGVVLTTTTGFVINGFLQWLPTFSISQGMNF